MFYFVIGQRSPNAHHPEKFQHGKAKLASSETASVAYLFPLRGARHGGGVPAAAGWTLQS